MKNKTIAVLSTLALAFFAFGATATAATEALPEDGSLLELARPVWDAIVHGNYWLAAAAGVILLTAATRKYLPDAWMGKYVRSQWGARAAAFIYAFAGALFTTLAAPGASMSMPVLVAALKIGGLAIGGWMALHALAKALVATKFYQDKVPAPVKALVAFVLNLIDSSAAALAKAEKAGQDAVDANPPKGPEAVTGDVGKI